MSSNDSSTLEFSQNDEELALKAVQTSAELLRRIELARNHVERAFRVQIEQNTDRTHVSEDDTLALEFILMELASIKTTVEVDQFYPRIYFSHRLSVERTFDKENASTFSTLKKFTEKYTVTAPKQETKEADSELENPPVKTWCDEKLAEIARFANFDAVDVRRYLKARFPHVAPERGASEETSWESSGWSSETLVSGAKGKVANGGKAANGVLKANGTGNGVLSQTPKTKTKNKSLFKNGLFGLKKKDSKGSNKELVAQSRAILDRCERLGK